MGIKYKVNEKFFDKWSSSMAYVLGYLYADGSLEDASYLRGKYIRVTSIDQLSIKNIKKLMDSEHKIINLGPGSQYSGKDRYFLRIGSHALYSSLIKLGLHPKKSLTMTFPVVPKKFLSDFVRGYFDGDGCVYLYTVPGQTKKLIVKKLSTIFTSGSEIFLKRLCNILQNKLTLSQRKIYKNQRAFQLRYSTLDSLKLFAFFYNSCEKNLYLKRKLDIFKCYFNLRPQKGVHYRKIFDRLKKK